MKNKLFFVAMAAFVLACLLLPPLLIAQPTNDFVPDASDEKVREVLGRYSLVKVLLIPLTTVLVMLARKWIGKIPDQVWPIAAPFIGALLDYAGARFGFWTGSPEAGLAVGGLAVWFSQLGKQTKEALTDGLSTTKAGKTNEVNTPPSNPS